MKTSNNNELLAPKPFYNILLRFIMFYNKILGRCNMAQAVINLTEHEDRILNIVKGKYGVKNKSDAIKIVIEKFEEEFLEPQIKPEYLKKLEKIHKGKYLKFNSVEELRASIEKRSKHV